MANTPKYEKVTVIIEDDDAIHTIEIPKAMDVSWEAKWEEPETDFTRTNIARPPELVALIMSLRPLKDVNGVTHTMKREDKKIPDLAEKLEAKRQEADG